MHLLVSEPWEPPQFHLPKKGLRVQKAILGGILEILGHSWSNSRNGADCLGHATPESGGKPRFQPKVTHEGVPTLGFLPSGHR